MRLQILSYVTLRFYAKNSSHYLNGKNAKQFGILYIYKLSDFIANSCIFRVLCSPPNTQLSRRGSARDSTPIPACKLLAKLTSVEINLYENTGLASLVPPKCFRNKRHACCIAGHIAKMKSAWAQLYRYTVLQISPVTQQWGWGTSTHVEVQTSPVSHPHYLMQNTEQSVWKHMTGSAHEFCKHKSWPRKHLHAGLSLSLKPDPLIPKEILGCLKLGICKHKHLQNSDQKTTESTLHNIINFYCSTETLTYQLYNLILIFKSIFIFKMHYNF